MTFNAPLPTVQRFDTKRDVLVLRDPVLPSDHRAPSITRKVPCHDELGGLADTVPAPSRPTLRHGPPARGASANVAGSVLSVLVP